MLPESKWKQYGLPNASLECIVVHNTNNQKASAERLEMWLENECKSSTGCHFLVDHKEVRQVMPLDWSVWNTGMGMDYGNLHGIAIEICSNPNTKLYLEGQARAIELIKELMAEFKISESAIFFHRDFQPNINCPAQILKLYGSKANFLALLKGDKHETDEQQLV